MRRRSLLGESKPTLTLSSTGSTAALYSGTTTFQVYYNDALLTSATPTISSNQSWATTSYTRSNGTVTLTRKGNFSKSTRAATITVSYSGLSATYSLAQQHGTTLTFSPNKTVEPTQGVEYVYFYVDGYLVDDDGMDYITYQKSDPYSMIGCSPQYDDDNDIHIPYCSNTGTTSRSLSYSISWGGTSVGTYTLTQKADYITATTTGSVVSTTYKHTDISATVNDIYLYGSTCNNSSLHKFKGNDGFNYSSKFGVALIESGYFNVTTTYNVTYKWASGKANTYGTKTVTENKNVSNVEVTAMSNTYGTSYMTTNRNAVQFELYVQYAENFWATVVVNAAECTQQDGVYWGGDSITASYNGLSATARYGGCFG